MMSVIGLIMFDTKSDVVSGIFFFYTLFKLTISFYGFNSEQD